MLIKEPNLSELRDQMKTAQKITTNKMNGSYECPELYLPSVRIGADDHLAHPSRNGSTLLYKDGRKEKIPSVQG